MLEGHGILCDRKTIYSDIAALQDFGIDILIYRGKNGGYYIGERQFQLPELKLLIGAVQSSRFLTEEKSLELIDKLCRLCSQEEAEQVRRNVVVAGRITADDPPRAQMPLAVIRAGRARLFGAGTARLALFPGLFGRQSRRFLCFFVRHGLLALLFVRHVFTFRRVFST